MDGSLFRPEAVEFQRRRAWAGPAAAPPLSSWLLTGFFMLGIGAAACFLGLASYVRKETVPGYIAPVAGLARVMPPAPGVIAAVPVSEGQTVRAGQLLVTVRTERTDRSGEAVEAAMAARLNNRREALADRIALEHQSAAIQRRTIGDALAGLEREAAALARSLETQRERVRMAGEQVEAVRGTTRQGYTSVTEFRRRQDSALQQQQAEADLSRQLAVKMVEVNARRDALAELERKTADNLANLNAAVAEAEAALADLQGKRGYAVVAPIAGRISALQAAPGNAADPAIPLMTILPEGVDLEAELLVPPRAIGFVAAGQPVRLAYDAFPFQRFGRYGGVVKAVSSTLLRPADTVAALAPKDPAYRVAVRLDRQSVTAYGRDVALRPDMSLQADIVIERRSLLHWLFDPLLAAGARL